MTGEGPQRSFSKETGNEGKKQIFIELCVGIEHKEQTGSSKTANHVFLPDNPTIWKERIEEALKKEEEISVAITNLPSNTVGCSIAFFPGVPDTGKNALIQLENGEAFGFITDIATLRALVRALNIAVDEYLE